MTSHCEKWNDGLLEAALSDTVAPGLEQHLLDCASCASKLATLRERRERLETLLPLVAQGAEPAPDFRARVLAAVEAAGEAKRWWPFNPWATAGAVAIGVVVLAVGWNFNERAKRPLPEADLAAAKMLAEWRAPSDVLLETPGQDILRTTPRLGESYLRGPAKKLNEDKERGEMR